MNETGGGQFTSNPIVLRRWHYCFRRFENDAVARGSDGESDLKMLAIQLLVSGTRVSKLSFYSFMSFYSSRSIKADELQFIDAERCP